MTLQIIALREFQLKMAAWQKWFVQILTHIHNKKESVRKRTFLIKILVYSNGRSSCMNSNLVGKKNIYSDFVFCENTLRQMRPFRQFRCNDNGTNALRIDIHISTLLSRWYLIKLSTTFSKSMIISRNNNNRKKKNRNNLYYVLFVCPKINRLKLHKWLNKINRNLSFMCFDHKPH